MVGAMHQPAITSAKNARIKRVREVREGKHEGLVLGPDGRRLAKRHGDTRLSYFRQLGVRPEAITGFLAHSAGLIDRPRDLSPEDLLDFYDLARITPEPFTLDHSPW